MISFITNSDNVEYSGLLNHSLYLISQADITLTGSLTNTKHSFPKFLK